MRRVWIVGSLLIAGCAIRGPGAWPVAPGGSVTDFDRSAAGAPAYSDTATPAGANDTIGVASTNGSERRPRQAVAWPEPLVPPSEGTLVAGPPLPGRAISEPATVRALQRALSERGYYQGPIDGVASAALIDAIGRFQADAKLPSTGRLDGATAAALGVTLPPPPLPPRNG